MKCMFFLPMGWCVVFVLGGFFREEGRSLFYKCFSKKGQFSQNNHGEEIKKISSLIFSESKHNLHA